LIHYPPYMTHKFHNFIPGACCHPVRYMQRIIQNYQNL
jgi:hypothetical protein